MSSTSGADPEGARLWFGIAMGDLVAARRLADAPDIPTRHAAALAQQAAEKAMKALIVFGGQDPPRTHDLQKLWASLRTEGLPFPAPVDLAELSDGLRTGRYPGLDEPTSAAIDFVAGAAAIIEIVRAHLEVNGVELETVEPA